MSSSETPALDTFGASVRGPAHHHRGEPNQDAWVHAPVAGGRVLVVSDGLGSRTHAREGARAACAAGVEAARIWVRRGAEDLRLLTALIQILWQTHLPPGIAPGEAAATCLFLLSPDEGPAIALQLGDGLVLTRQNGEATPLASRDPDAFGNETLALGLPGAQGGWRHRVLDKGPFDALLCTDGVSEDLLSDTLDDFLTWLCGTLAPMPPDRRWRALVRELKHWPTPGHIDDKTLCVLRRLR